MKPIFTITLSLAFSLTCFNGALGGDDQEISFPAHKKKPYQKKLMSEFLKFEEIKWENLGTNEQITISPGLYDRYIGTDISKFYQLNKKNMDAIHYSITETMDIERDPAQKETLVDIILAIFIEDALLAVFSNHCKTLEQTKFKIDSATWSLDDIKYSVKFGMSDEKAQLAQKALRTLKEYSPELSIICKTPSTTETDTEDKGTANTYDSGNAAPAIQ